MSLASSGYFMQTAKSFRFSIWHKLKDVEINNEIYNT